MAVGTIRVVVKGKNIDITDALRNYTEKHAAKLGKFFAKGQELFVEAVLAVEREVQYAEITVQAGGLLVRGEGKTSDMYASIDEALDHIERQIKKHKTRIQRRAHGPKLSETFANEFVVDTEDDQLPKVVRTKRFPMKPMSVEEAIMQMELLGHDFFVFSNAGTGDVNVVYRRRDGDYGLIEPEL